uniref:Uncharacterized protein n=1 Tax=Oryza sativa subsp. japonica TaxID=39947 RepID=Q6ZJM6_ORYSJ|nr:hypothetical protein [Oryza sativa Japonica Group]
MLHFYRGRIFFIAYKNKEKVRIISPNYRGRPNYHLNHKTEHSSPLTIQTGRITPPRPNPRWFWSTWRTRGSPISILFIKKCGTHLSYYSHSPSYLSHSSSLTRQQAGDRGERGSGGGEAAARQGGGAAAAARRARQRRRRGGGEAGRRGGGGGEASAAAEEARRRRGRAEGWRCSVPRLPPVRERKSGRSMTGGSHIFINK